LATSQSQYPNPFSAQQKQKGIISPNDSIFAIIWLQRTVKKERNALNIISNKGHQIEIENITFLINDLEI